MKKLSILTLAMTAALATGIAHAQFQERNLRVSNGVSKEHPMGNGLAKMGECTLAKSGADGSWAWATGAAPGQHPALQRLPAVSRSRRSRAPPISDEPECRPPQPGQT